MEGTTSPAMQVAEQVLHAETCICCEHLSIVCSFAKDVGASEAPSVILRALQAVSSQLELA